MIRAAGHLLALWGFAVLQPTLDVLGSGPDLFISRQIEGWPFVFVLILFAFAPPLLLVAIEGLVQLIGGQSWRIRTHMLFVAGLLVPIALQVLELVRPGGGVELLGGAILIGALAAWAYAHLEPVRSLCSVLSVAPVVFLISFLLSSPARDLIFPSQAVAAAEVHGRDVPVVMVVIDEFPLSSILDPNGQINSKRFPNFARLAGQSTWFRNDSSVADETFEALPAILTGDRPRDGQLPTLKDHPQNLFTLLGSSYDVHAMEHATWLCPPSLCPSPTPLLSRMTELASAMSLTAVRALAPERHVPSVVSTVGRTWGEALASKSPEKTLDADELSIPELARHGGLQFEHFLEMIDPWDGQGRPPFYFLHSSLPHEPWFYAPSGKLYTAVKRDLSGFDDGAVTWSRDPGLVTHFLQRHILQVGVTDRLIGRLIARLKSTGLWNRALVVVTADHGASFLPGRDFRVVRRYNAGDVGMIPLFIKSPGQTKPQVVARHVTAIDVLPTMARMLGIRIPWSVDGRPALDRGFQQPRSVSIFRHLDGSAIDVPFSLLLHERTRTVRRNQELLGGGGFTSAFYGIGPDRRLVGRRIESLGQRRLPGTSVELEQAGDLAQVDPKSPYEPLLLSGTIDGGRAAGLRSIMIALRGRVAAVAPIHEQGGARFVAMIPQRLLHPGANRVTLFAVSSDGEINRLQGP